MNLTIETSTTEPMGLPAEILTVTQVVYPDEKAYFLTEVCLPSGDYKRTPRYQVIYVNRDDRITPWVRDLTEGLSGEALERMQEAPPFRIPSLWEHTVAELAALADEHRDENRMLQIMRDAKEASTLLDDFVRLAEWRQRIKHNQSHFGPLSTGRTSGTQRNGMP